MPDVLMENEPDEVEFGIISDEAFVASAATVCMTCEAEIEVICLYCERGVDAEMGEAILRATLSNIWAMDEGLMTQLESFPSFKRIDAAETEEGIFANHCAHCGAIQEEHRLHAEPEDVFFNVADAEPGSVKLTPLVGWVGMSGDYGFGV